MLISNLEVIPDRRVVKHLGLVQGSSVRAKHVGRDIMASIKNLFGGEFRGGKCGAECAFFHIKRGARRSGNIRVWDSGYSGVKHHDFSDYRFSGANGRRLFDW